MNLLCWTKWLLNFEEDQYPYLDFCDTRINQGLFINTYTSTLLLKIMHCARSPKLRPRPNVSGYFLKRIFFVRRFSLLFDSHVNGILGHQTLLKSFKNGPQITCGQTKTEFFEYDAVIKHIQLTLRMLCKGY